MKAREPFRYVVALLALAAAAAAFAAPSRPLGSVVGQTVLADSRMSMDQAVKMAEQKFKARVVRAESQDLDGKVVYILRLLNDSGRVWTVRVDAATGTVI